MSRKRTLLFMIIGGAAYHAFMGVIGMTSIERAASELFDMTYWGGAVLFMHWLNAPVTTD